MYIDRIKIRNYKQFKDLELKLNPIRNIFIGENGAGKTSLIEAIGHVLGANDRSIENIGIQSLFNTEVIHSYLTSEKKYEDLPVLKIELFIADNHNRYELMGIHNSESVEQSGLSMSLRPNEEYSKEIADVLENSDIFPFDYYKVEFKTFDGRTYNSYKRYLNYSVIDSTKVNSQRATQSFIESFYLKEKTKEERAKLQHQYREESHRFSEKVLKSADDSNYQLRLNTHKGKVLEENLTIQKDNIDITNFGRGDSMFLNIEFALSRTKDSTNVILIEEPENHLSHLNMHKLIQRIDESNEKQIFIATHSNMIATRLDLQNALFLAEGRGVKLNDLDGETSRFFQKSPDNNVLNFILSDKVILVEGDAEYILLNSFYKELRKEDMYDNGISMISVGGLSFKRYLEIALKLGKKVAVITDNDRDYQKNILDLYSEYKYDNIEIFAPENEDEFTFEVCLYKNNHTFFEEYLKNPQMSNGVQAYMLSNKAEAAFRLLNLLENDSLYNKFEIPTHIKEAYQWINL
ncbi:MULTISPECIES: ATP-dependent nuclease [Bacillaceae]|uniref:ATP-dependent nuclease n=1 Tax=Bacillaceae TaxID=186817 RepID=UPI00103167DF|nr:MULTISPECIES: TOPRIM nucleotidyl transferase/hydrolase domain-containing protein [Bacillaceae]